MDGNTSIRRSSRTKKAPARLVPGEGGGLKTNGSHVSELDSVSEDAEESAETHDSGEPSQPIDSDPSPSSHEPEQRTRHCTSGVQSAHKRNNLQPRRPPTRKRGRQTQDGAAQASSRGCSSFTDQQGKHALQANASLQGPGFQDLPQAALSATTSVLLPSQFPASNPVSCVPSSLWSGCRLCMHGSLLMQRPHTTQSRIRPLRRTIGCAGCHSSRKEQGTCLRRLTESFKRRKCV